MLSYWEKTSLLDYNNIIIGSGLTGLNTAIELHNKYPNERILILERSIIPFGASTRNAGFVCMGSLTELIDDSSAMSHDNVINLFIRRKTGLDKLRQRLGDEHIGFRADGSHELLTEQDLPALEHLEFYNNALKDFIKDKPVYQIANHKIDTFGFDKNKIKALVETTCEGQLHTGMLMRRLTDYVLSLGVEIKTGAKVQRFEKESNKNIVIIEDNTRNTSIPISCKRLIICTNAFTASLLNGEDVVPGRGQIILTKPIPNLPLKGIFHYDKGFYYFRELEGRILFGGGRNLDFAKETTTEIEYNNFILQDLSDKLQQIILPHHPFEIEMQWAGIMAFGKNKTPIIKSFGNNIYGAFRLGGMGVALSTLVAEDLVKIME